MPFPILVKSSQVTIQFDLTLDLTWLDLTAVLYRNQTAKQTLFPAFAAPISTRLRGATSKEFFLQYRYLNARVRSARPSSP